jgi:hypothetical protein
MKEFYDMKRILILTLTLVLLLGLAATPAMADKGGKKADCATITHGEVYYSSTHYMAGQTIPTGYDGYGYNYQGHMFSGSFANVYLGGDGFPPYEGDDEAYLAENPLAANHWSWPYRDIKLLMKWNDAWLSNKDCDGDGKLDRHYGFDSYVGSGAWETNHQWGSYEDDGEVYQWNYFCKIVAVPADAYVEGVSWYTADGAEIGPVIWGAFATVFEVYNDQGTGEHGVYYNSPAPTGFGYYKP